MKSRILTDEEEKICKDESARNFVIGQSPLENLRKAVILEYITGCKPIVSRLKENLKDLTMERYASLLAIYAVEKFGKGKIERSPDGCSSDLMFSLDEINYLGIQIKTTTNIRAKKRKNKSTNYGWHFSCMNKNYSGFLMYLRSLSDGMSWLIPYQLVNKYYSSPTLIIANTEKYTKIKWDNYRVDNDNLALKIYQYYCLALNPNFCELKLKSYESLLATGSISHQIKKETRKKIIDILLKAAIEIKRPELENMTYDFIIGDLKVQDKISSKTTGKRKGFIVNLDRHFKQKFIPYNKEDFDILLIHCPPPYENIFYFIPIDKLVEHSYVTSNQIEGKKSMKIYPEELMEIGKDKTKDCWTEEFLCYYNDPNLIKKLIALYNKQHKHIPYPIRIDDPIFWNIICKNMTALVNKWQIERTYPLKNPNFTFFLYGYKILERALILENGSFKLHITRYNVDVDLPFEKGKFDYVYCKPPQKYEKLFYLIPSYKLEKYGMLKTDKCKGQKKLLLTSPETQICYSSNTWTVKFAYYYNDENLKQKLLALFAKYSA